MGAGAGLCRGGAADFSRRRLRMSVNLSARQFREDGFVPSLRALLRTTGQTPRCSRWKSPKVW